MMFLVRVLGSLKNSLLCSLQLLVDLGSNELENKHPYWLINPLHFLESSFNSLQLVQVRIIHSLLILFHPHLISPFFSPLICFFKQGRGWKMDCFCCCYITPFLPKTFPRYSTGSTHYSLWLNLVTLKETQNRHTSILNWNMREREKKRHKKFHLIVTR